MIARVLTSASCTQPTCDLTNRHIPSLQRASGSGRAYRDLAPGGRAAQVADCEDVAAHRARRRIPDGLRGPLLGCLRRGSIGSSYTSSLSQNVFPTPLPASPSPYPLPTYSQPPRAGNLLYRPKPIEKDEEAKRQLPNQLQLQDAADMGMPSQLPDPMVEVPHPTQHIVSTLTLNHTYTAFAVSCFVRANMARVSARGTKKMGRCHTTATKNFRIPPPREPVDEEPTRNTWSVRLFIR